jgi:YVTN family beta-propeller protein
MATPVETEIVYVVNQIDRTVSVIEANTNQIVATLFVGESPRRVAITPDKTRVLIMGGDVNGFVLMIDTATDEVVARIWVGRKPEGIAFVSVNNSTHAYVTNCDSDTVSVIELETKAVITTIPVRNQPIGVEAVIQDPNKHVYITCYRSDNVSIIDTATNQVIQSVQVGNGPKGIGLSFDGTRVYVANCDSRSVSIINVANYQVIDSIQVEQQSPEEVKQLLDGAQKHICVISGNGNSESNNLSVIDTVTNQVMKNVRVGYRLGGIAFTRNGFAYVSMSGGLRGCICVIDCNQDQNRMVKATLFVGNGPCGIATALVRRMQATMAREKETTICCGNLWSKIVRVLKVIAQYIKKGFRLTCNNKLETIMILLVIALIGTDFGLLYSKNLVGKGAELGKTLERLSTATGFSSLASRVSPPIVSWIEGFLQGKCMNCCTCCSLRENRLVMHLHRAHQTAMFDLTLRENAYCTEKNIPLPSDSTMIDVQVLPGEKMAWITKMTKPVTTITPTHTGWSRFFCCCRCCCESSPSYGSVSTIDVGENQIIDTIPVRKGPIKEAVIILKKERACIIRQDAEEEYQSLFTCKLFYLHEFVCCCRNKHTKYQIAVRNFHQIKMVSISEGDGLRICAFCADIGVIFIIDPKKAIHQQIIGSVHVGTATVDVDTGQSSIQMMTMPDNDNLVLIINVEQKIITIFNAVNGRPAGAQPVIPSMFQPADQLKRIVITRYETYVICRKNGENRDKIFLFPVSINGLQSESIAIKDIEMSAACVGAAVDLEGHWFVAADTSDQNHGKLLVIWRWKRYWSEIRPALSVKTDKETDKEANKANEAGERDRLILGEAETGETPPRRNELKEKWDRRYVAQSDPGCDITSYTVQLQGIPNQVRMDPGGSLFCATLRDTANAAVLYRDGNVRYTEAGDVQDPIEKMTFSSTQKPAKRFNQICILLFWLLGIITMGVGVALLVVVLVSGEDIPSIPSIPRHEACFPDLNGKCVWVHDLITNQPIARISGIGTPYAAAATPDGTRVYVTDAFNNTVSIIDTTSYTVIDTVFVETGPKGVAISPDATEVWVSHQIHQSIDVISTANNTVIATIPVGGDPQIPVFNPDRAEVYVVNTGNNTVSVIESDTHQLILTIDDVGPSPRNIAMVDKTTAYVTIGGNHSVDIIDVATGEKQGTISVGMEPWGVVVIAEKKRAYVTNSASNTVSVIGTASNLVLLNISVGRQPEQLVLHPNQTRVYVANRIDQTASVIDVDTNQVIATILLPVHAPVSSMTITPDGNYIVTTHDNEEHIAIVDTTTNTAKWMLIGNDPLTVSLQEVVFTKWD